MFIIVESKNFDDYIKVDKLSSHNNKPSAVNALKKLLLEDIFIRTIKDGDINDDFLKENLEVEVDKIVTSFNPKYEFNDGSYILLKYNRAKIFSEYVIPSFNEKGAKTISIIAF